jgi:hypothetical protein
MEGPEAFLKRLRGRGVEIGAGSIDLESLLGHALDELRRQYSRRVRRRGALAWRPCGRRVRGLLLVIAAAAGRDY